MKVLVIDDNKETTDMLSLYFEAQGIALSAINNGRQGLEAVLNEEANLVLLDIAMPDFSGLDIVSYLRKENLIESKNIVILTASSISGDLLNDLKKMGVKAILNKPLDMDELQEMITKFKPA